MLVFPTLALAALVQEPAPQARPDIAAIEAAVQALQEADNYTFVHTTLESGTPMGPRGGGRGGDAARGRSGGGADGAADGPPAPEPVVTTGHVQKGQPLHLQQGQEQAWRDGQGNLVYLDADGSWKPLDRGAMRGAFGGRGGRGGDAPQDAESREAQRAEREVLRARMGLLRVRPAAEALAAMPRGIDSVSVSEKGGKTVYTGTLTAEGAAAMGGGGMAMRGGRGGRGGGQDGGPQTSGAYMLVVGASGVLESVVVETTTKGSFGDRAFERSRRMEFQVRKVGETALEVPDAVRKGLEEAASARSARERERERGNEEF